MSRPSRPTRAGRPRLASAGRRRRGGHRAGSHGGDRGRRPARAAAGPLRVRVVAEVRSLVAARLVVGLGRAARAGTRVMVHLSAAAAGERSLVVPAAARSLVLRRERGTRIASLRAGPEACGPALLAVEGTLSVPPVAPLVGAVSAAAAGPSAPATRSCHRGLLTGADAGHGLGPPVPCRRVADPTAEHAHANRPVADPHARPAVGPISPPPVREYRIEYLPACIAQRHSRAPPSLDPDPRRPVHGPRPCRPGRQRWPRGLRPEARNATSLNHDPVSPHSPDRRHARASPSRRPSSCRRFSGVAWRQRMRYRLGVLWRDHGLSIALVCMFMVAWALQTWTGWVEFVAATELSRAAGPGLRPGWLRLELGAVDVRELAVGVPAGLRVRGPDDVPGASQEP